MANAIKEIGGINRDIDGPPRAESIRGRLHQLEDAAATANLASEAAIQTAKAVGDVRRGFWRRWERLAAIAGIAIGVGVGIANLLGVGR